MPELQIPALQRTRSLTQQQKVVAEMCANQDKTWWLPSDFMKGGQYFVGYEASARLSELQSENPDMFESKRIGRFMARRLCFETVLLWFPHISSELQWVIKQHINGERAQ